MELFKATVKIESPLATPLQADTIFGHICWGIVFSRGEKKLEAFLQAYEDKTKDPPFIVSNGFPHNMLPFPVLTPYIPEKTKSMEEAAEWKNLKKHKFIPADFFLNGSESFSIPKLKELLKPGSTAAEKHSSTETVQRMHNTINRITGTTGDEGSLFTAKETWIWKNGNIRDIYIQSSFKKEQIKELLVNAFAFGYGADRSTGRGSISVNTIEKATFPDTGNRVMALAHFVPDESEELQNLRAGTITKYGKLGELSVHTKNPFKKPIVFFQAGATWNRNREKHYFGRLLHNIHADERIRHHAFTPVIPFQEEVPHVEA